jgi:hypothetical protein
VLSRGQGWFGALTVMLITVGLAILDLTDAPLRRWWEERDFTTSVVAGILVLLVTVVVVDRVVGSRQVKDRAQAVGAQAAIIVSQALRASTAMSASLDGSGERAAASEELRTYVLMLLIAAPLLIDAPISRGFLEDAQRLAGECARALATSATAASATTASKARVAAAVDQVRATSKPLLKTLDLTQLVAVAGEGLEDPAATG